MPSKTASRGYYRRGVSLVELLVALAIAAVLLTLAVPAFGGLLDRARAVDTANRLVGDLMFARGEAMERGTRVRVHSDDWRAGWRVSTLGERASEILARTLHGDAADVVPCGGGVPVFHPDGHVEGQTARRWRITGGSSAVAARIVELSPSGRARVSGHAHCL